MNKVSTKKLVLNGLMIALVFLATFFTRIPTPLPQGYFNLGDAVIIISAILLGRKSGLIAGGIGSLLADVSAGAFIFAPITLVVKGIEGYIIGSIASSEDGKSTGEVRKIAAAVIGALIMVAGYFLAEAFILGLFDEAFGFMAAVAELPANLLQGGLSVVVGYILTTILGKINIQKYL